MNRILAGVLAALTLAAQPNIGGCPIFPADHAWNTPVDHLPLDPGSSAYVNSIGRAVNVHPDFGSGLFDGGPIGIPFVVVPGSTLKQSVTFEYAGESDAGPYPIPPDPPIEGGAQSTGDRHILMVDRDSCTLYELFSAYPALYGSWRAGSGAIFDLRGYALRPASWTSADAAGLAILPGLVRYEEVAAGEIRHAIRFTASRTRRAYVWPARHFASSLTDASLPPMGQRFRLRADFDITGFHPENQVILRALKKYGMILADNGSNWFLSGVPDARWDNTRLRELRRIVGSDFEAVDASSLMIAPDSGRARQPASISVTHAATFEAGPVAPGLLVSIFGAGFATPRAVTVLFDGLRAPLLHVSDSQINAAVPFSVAGRVATRLEVQRDGVPLVTAEVPVASTAPGIFAALNQDFSLHSESNPAAAGSILLLFASGAGETDPPSRDGETSEPPLPLPKLASTVLIDGQPAPVLYAGAAPGLVAGAIQLNVEISGDQASGRRTLVWSIGGRSSPPFPIWIR